MGEAELVEIESRIEHYPPQARDDILRLIRALRRLPSGRSDKQSRVDSPLYDVATGLLNAGPTACASPWRERVRHGIARSSR